MQYLRHDFLQGNVEACREYDGQRNRYQEFTVAECRRDHANRQHPPLPQYRRVRTIRGPERHDCGSAVSVKNTSSSDGRASRRQSGQCRQVNRRMASTRVFAPSGAAWLMRSAVTAVAPIRAPPGSIGERNRDGRRIRRDLEALSRSRRVPVRLFSSSTVPSAMMVPPSISMIRSLSASASSRYWVVSSVVMPVLLEPSNEPPDALSATRIESRRRFVEECHRRAHDKAARNVDTTTHPA